MGNSSLGTKRIPFIQWWLKGRVAPSECLAAFQPIGANSIAQSLQNVNGRGVNDAVIGTTPTFSQKMGWTFDGSTTYLTVASSGAIKSGVPLSMICLFQSEDITSSYALMSINRTSVANHKFVLRASGAVASDPVVACSSAASEKSAASGIGYNANEWCVGAGVFAGASLRTAYILSARSKNTAFISYGNKVSETSSSTPASLDTTFIGCGHDASSTTSFLDGTIGACAFYSVALTDKQVMQIALSMFELV